MWPAHVFDSSISLRQAATSGALRYYRCGALMVSSTLMVGFDFISHIAGKIAALLKLALRAMQDNRP
jgi:hypothetical protein